VRRILRETGTVMAHALAGRGRRNVLGEEEVLHVIYCFHFVKFDINDNISDTNVKIRNSEKVPNLKKLYLHFLFQIISPTTFLIIVCTRALNHSVFTV
jgi:hypothetical protein